MGAQPFYGSFHLTGLGVCLQGCQVRSERGSEGFFTQTFTPNFLQENRLQPKSSFCRFSPIMPINDITPDAASQYDTVCCGSAVSFRPQQQS